MARENSADRFLIQVHNDFQAEVLELLDAALDAKAWLEGSRGPFDGITAAVAYNSHLRMIIDYLDRTIDKTLKWYDPPEENSQPKIDLKLLIRILDKTAEDKKRLNVEGDKP